MPKENYKVRLASLALSELLEHPNLGKATERFLLSISDYVNLRQNITSEQLLWVQICYQRIVLGKTEYKLPDTRLFIDPVVDQIAAEINREGLLQ